MSVCRWLVWGGAITGAFGFSLEPTMRPVDVYVTSSRNHCGTSEHIYSGRWSHLVGLGWAYWISCGRWSQLRDSWCVVAYTHKVDWHVRSHYMSYLVKCDIYLGCVMWNVTHWIFGSKYTFGSWFSIVDNRTGHYPFWDFNCKLKFGGWGDITCQLI